MSKISVASNSGAQAAMDREGPKVRIPCGRSREKAGYAPGMAS